MVFGYLRKKTNSYMAFAISSILALSTSTSFDTMMPAFGKVKDAQSRVEMSQDRKSVV